MEYLRKINQYFEMCESESIKSVNFDYNRLAEAHENLFIEYKGSGDYTYKTYIYNVKEWRDAFTYRLDYKKGGAYSTIPRLRDSRIELTQFQKDMFERVETYENLKSEIIERYPSKWVECMATTHRSFRDINKYIHEYFESQKASLIARVEKKGGKIIDAIQINVRLNELNGLFSCENGVVKVQTIFAGGYNIQCLHIRTLIKLLKG